MQDAITKHREMFYNVYGVENARPKHHYASHLPGMYRRFGFLLSVLTHERRHRLVKRYSGGRSPPCDFMRDDCQAPMERWFYVPWFH